MRMTDYKRVTLQMLKRIRKEEFWIKIYTYIKTLLEMQEANT